MNENLSCKTCKHWELSKYEDDETFEDVPAQYVGRCHRINHFGMENDVIREKDNEDFIACTCDGEDYHSALLTSEKFYCSLHELKS